MLWLAAVTAVGGIGGVSYYWARKPVLYRPGEQMAEITSTLVKNLPPGAPLIRFEDVTAAAGLGSFQSFVGDRTSQLPEDMGSGAAWGDFDNDGDDDLFLVSNGGTLDADASDRGASTLLENLGDGTFRPVEGFPETRIIGMGCAWGDYNHDGWLDLVVTGYDALRLFRNEQGTLVRDERFAGLPGFWAGASWADYDNDRDLDLYVCGYVQYREHEKPPARESRQFGTAVPYTLNPSSYEPQRNLLFRNEGDGTFTEVAEALGIANPEGRSLGAVWHDFDQDGWIDLYVANDISDNALYRNVEGRFVEISHAAWVADYRGAMGLAVGDYDRDGDDDIVVTHWIAQENALYESLLSDVRSLGPSSSPPPADQPYAGEAAYATVRFNDVADARGLGHIALQMIGWGAEFADLDADGWLDLVLVNGSTFETDDTPRRLRPQKSFVFWNREGLHFHDLAEVSPALRVPRVTHGLALSDYDRDGDVDVLMVNHAEGAMLLRNDTKTGRHLQLTLRSLSAGGEPHGFAEGATAVVHAGGVALRRSVSSVSYLSQSSRTLHFGLGDTAAIDYVDVHWPGGAVTRYEGIEPDRSYELRQGDLAPHPLEKGAESDSISERERVVTFWAKHRAAVKAMKVDEDLDGAIDLFREALALNPEHEDARFFLGNCLAARGDLRAAITELEELTRRNPRSHRGLKRLALLRVEAAAGADDLRAAIAILERALAINLEETGVLLAMGEVHLLLGEPDLAEERLALATRTNHQAAGGFFLLGYLAWKRGDPDRAHEMLRRAADARGPDWKPAGTTAEGDVAKRLHADPLPLAVHRDSWDGRDSPDDAFAALDAFLADAVP